MFYFIIFLFFQHEKKTYDILVKQLGEEDSRTRDSQNWMKTFKMRELQVNCMFQKAVWMKICIEYYYFYNDIFLTLVSMSAFYFDS